MITPVRIQRSRQHKQVSPNGLPIVYGGRPGKWGNAFKIVGDMIYGDASHRRKIFDPWVYITLANHYPKTMSLQQICIDLHERWIEGMEGTHIIPPPAIEDIKRELKCKNISCWCKLTDPCHCDTLLRIANS